MVEATRLRGLYAVTDPALNERLIAAVAEALEAAQTPVTVLTKSPLVMRDVEIFERMAA